MQTESKLTRDQKRVYGPIPYANGCTIKVTVRYDDESNNGHNTFAITASIYDGRGGWSGGCQHDDVAKAFPELAPLIKFHLVSSNEPMHYLANTLYWLGYDARWCDGKETSPPNLEHARASAVWPDMPETMLCTAAKDDSGAIELQRAEASRILTERLASVQREFRAAVESLGFVW